MKIIAQKKRQGTEYNEKIILCTIEIKLKLNESRLFQVKLLILIPRAGIIKITLKYSNRNKKGIKLIQ